MPTQLQLDGPDLEELLTRVRSELGPDARIVSADKVRTGGIAGFFARERYEVCVETDDAPADPATGPASPHPASATAAVPGGFRPLAAGAPTAATRTPASAPAAAAAPAAVPTLLGLADAVSDHERAVISTESAAFGQVLRQLAADGGPVLPTARQVPAQRDAEPARPDARPDATQPSAAQPGAPLAGSPLAGSPLVGSPLAGGPVAGTPASPARPRRTETAPSAAAAAGQAEDTRFADALAAAAGRQERRTPTGVHAAPAASAATTATPTTAPAVAPASWYLPSSAASSALPVSTPATCAPDSAAALLLPTADHREVAVTQTAVAEHPAAAVPYELPVETAVAVVAEPAAVAVVPQARVAVVREPSPADRVAAGLSLLGLPHHLVPQVGPEGVRTALARALALLPQAPEVVDAPGQVLAVVGPGALALAVGLQVTAELELDPDKTLLFAGPRPAGLAADRVLSTVGAVAQRRVAWRKRRSLGILVVDSPLTAAGAVHANEVLEAMQPTVVMGAVEASRKPTDIARWAEFLGGVDSLAVQEIESSSDPATVLATGIPVGRLGHEVADADTWAALLTSRLAC